MNKILVGGLLGGLTLYVWGWISWAALPWHNATIHDFPDGEKVVQMLQTKNAAAGVYGYPSHEMMEKMVQAREAAATKGEPTAAPLAIIFFNPTAGDPSQATPYVVGFIISFLIASILGYLLIQATGALNTFGKKVGFTTLIGIAAALISHINFWNWMGAATDYSLVMAIDTVIGFLLAGIALAWWTSRPATMTTPTV